MSKTEKMKQASFIVGFALSWFVSGCESLRAGASPQQPSWFSRPSYSLNVIYRAPLVAESRRHGEAYERGQVEIDVKHQRLFVGSSDHGLYCVDARSGTSLWRFETVGHVQSAPLYDAANEVVYFGSDDGALYKLDARNGQVRYRFATNSEVAMRPVLAKDRIFFANANDTVIAIDAKTGKMLWNQHRAPVSGMQIAGSSGILVWGNRVYAGFSDGSVVAFDATTGAERFPPVDLAAEVDLSLGTVPQHFDVDTTPVPGHIDGNPVIYVASAEGGLFALDADSGTQVWHNPAVIGTTELLLWGQSVAQTEPVANVEDDGADESTASESAPVSRQLLIAATGSSGLWALDPNEGSVVWRARLPDGGVAGPVPYMGALLVTASQLGIYLVSPLNGKVIDGLHMTEGVSALPSVYGSRAFVLTNQGYLTALHVAAPGALPSVFGNSEERNAVFGSSYSTGAHW